MSLFGKKKEKTSCCCGGDCNAEAMQEAKEAQTCGADVKVLGGGCAKCKALAAAAKEALTELGMSEEIDHVTDFAQIAAYGVMTTPALVYRGKVISYGNVLNKEEVIKLLQEER